VPSSALIFNAQGLSVAAVDSSNRVQIKPVSIERDLGAIVELGSGLASSDRVVENPPDGIGNGALVHVTGAAPGGALASRAKEKNDKG
jgi:hypothetical protein